MTLYNSNVQEKACIDQGLRAYMLKTYQYMSAGLLISCVAAFLFAEITFLRSLVYSPVYYANHVVGYKMSVIGFFIQLSPIGIVMYMRYKGFKMSVSSAKMWFFTYATTVGISLSSICMIYTYSSITTTFLICTILFGMASLYGYTTKQYIGSYADFIKFGLIGLALAILVNFILRNTLLDLIISIAGVGIFTYLLADNTQKIKLSYYSVLNNPHNENFAIFSALEMYTNLVNLFVFLIRLTGVFRTRKE